MMPDEVKQYLSRLLEREEFQPRTTEDDRFERVIAHVIDRIFGYFDWLTTPEISGEAWLDRQGILVLEITLLLLSTLALWAVLRRFTFHLRPRLAPAERPAPPSAENPESHLHSGDWEAALAALRTSMRSDLVALHIGDLSRTDRELIADLSPSSERHSLYRAIATTFESMAYARRSVSADTVQDLVHRYRAAA